MTIFLKRLGESNAVVDNAFDDDLNASDLTEDSIQNPDLTEAEAEYQEVTVISWWQRLFGAVIGLLFGTLLFLASFAVLFFNEGSTDFSRVAQGAVVVAPTAIAPTAQGKTVSITGNITATPAIGDRLYLQPGAYVALVRTVEMYAWQETKDTDTQKNWGGSTTRTTRYHYTKAWTDSPKPSNTFKKPNHSNPPQPFKNQLFKASMATIGRYHIALDPLTNIVNFPMSCTSDNRRYSPTDGTGISLPLNARVQLTPQTLLATLPPKSQRVDNYIFQGTGTPQSPKIGDLRICYTALPTNTSATVFGQLQGDRIVPARYQDESFFRLAPGAREVAIADLRSEYQLWLWVFRLVGFATMWVGIVLLLNPISVVLSVIPFLGDVADFVNGTASFVAAFVLSAVTILVSSLAHQPVVLLGAVVVSLVGLVVGRMLLRMVRT